MIGIHRAIENHVADMCGIERGVESAEVGAIGLTKIVKLGIAEEDAEDLHIFRGF